MIIANCDGAHVKTEHVFLLLLIVSFKDAESQYIMLTSFRRIVLVKTLLEQNKPRFSDLNGG